MTTGTEPLLITPEMEADLPKRTQALLAELEGHVVYLLPLGIRIEGVGIITTMSEVYQVWAVKNSYRGSYQLAADAVEKLLSGTPYRPLEGV